MKLSITARLTTAALALAVAVAAAAGCATGSPDAPLDDSTARGGSGVGGNAGGDGGLGMGSECGELALDELGSGVDAADRTLFDAASGASPAFVFDPPSGAVLPAGWPSPTFLAHTPELPAFVQLELSLGSGETVRFTAKPRAAEPAHADSTVDGAWWTVALPETTWKVARCRSVDIGWRLLHVATGTQAPAGASSGTLRLIDGAEQPDMTYLGIEQPPTLSVPSSFSVERLAVASGTPQTLVEKDAMHCIGCHTSSPDGQELIYQRPGEQGGWRVDVVRPLGEGQTEPSPILSAAASQWLGTTELMVPNASAGAWSDQTGRWLTAVTHEGRIAMLQLDGSASADGGVSLAPAIPSWNGDELRAASPVLAPDASRVLLVATDSMIDGYFDQGQIADLWQVPVALSTNATPTFGEPSPVPHASATAANETHPSFSGDGALIGFTRTAAGSRGYDEETAEIWVMPADGSAEPTRLDSNDAPTDDSVYEGLGLSSSWARFGRSSVQAAEGTYYFVLFSSRRGSPTLWEDRSLGSNHIAGRPMPRLYLTVVLRRNDGSLESFPAVLVPGQRANEGAHTATFVTVTSVDPPEPPAE
jgi:hypothetical protein